MHSSRNHTLSPSSYPSPSITPDSASIHSDSDWSATSGSEWTSPSSISSRSTSPAHPARPIDHAIQNILAAMSPRPSTPAPATPATPATYSPIALPQLQPAVPETPKRKRIPRPPNAFMLYRSNLLKTGAIPPDVEQRQQNISRVAGECWNLLPQEEKEIWHAQAREVLAKHKLNHPDYKFSPERKSLKRKALGDEECRDGKDYIKRIRETYCGIAGDAVSPPRPRKPKSRRGAEAHTFAGVPESSSPRSQASRPAPSGPPPIPITHYTPSPYDTRALFAGYTFPPNTTSAPTPGAEQYVHYSPHQTAYDNDVTPRASTFGIASSSTAPKFEFPLAIHPYGGPSSIYPHPAPEASTSESSTSCPTPEPCTTAFDDVWKSMMIDPFNNPTTPVHDGPHTPGGDNSSLMFMHSDNIYGPLDLPELPEMRYPLTPSKSD